MEDEEKSKRDERGASSRRTRGSGIEDWGHRYSPVCIMIIDYLRIINRYKVQSTEHHTVKHP